MPQDLPLSFLVFGLGALAANAGFAALLSLVAERKGAPSSFLPYLDPWPMGLASAALSTLLVSAFL